jgi:hypothetical protein
MTPIPTTSPDNTPLVASALRTIFAWDFPRMELGVTGLASGFPVCRIACLEVVPYLILNLLLRQRAQAGIALSMVEMIKQLTNI